MIRRRYGQGRPGRGEDRRRALHHQWASQVVDLTTAYWQPILNGKKPVSDLQTYVGKVNDLIKTAG